MAEVVVMPKMGLTALEATLVKWHRDLGDPIEEGDIICDVETDKIANEVEATTSGTLLRRSDIDQVIPIGEPIAVIGEPDEDASGFELFDPSRASAETEMETAAPARPAAAGRADDAGSVDGRRRVSPAARRRAHELGVDLDGVGGSGPGGRVTLDDVEAAGDTPSGERVELTPLRRAVARNMILSAAVPQYTLERDVEVGTLTARVSGQDPDRDDRATVVDVLVAVLARRLRDHDRFLHSWADDHLVRHEDVDIGLAVALPEGLMVPVVRGVDTLDANDIAAERRVLQRRAQAGELTNDDVGRAVFTISNLGPFGIDRCTALVDPPQSGILGVGRIRERDGVSVMSLSLSADHRAVDGADGARLLQDVAMDLGDAARIDEVLKKASA